MISTDAAFIERIRHLANFGFERVRRITRPGFNAKMSEYAAAVGLAAFDGWPNRRRATAERSQWYGELLVDPPRFGLAPGFGPPALQPTLQHPLDPAARGGADRTCLQARGIGARKWWGDGCHRQPAFAASRHTALPVTEALADSVVGLPFFADISRRQMEQVATESRGILAAECLSMERRGSGAGEGSPPARMDLHEPTGRRHRHPHPGSSAHRPHDSRHSRPELYRLAMGAGQRCRESSCTEEVVARYADRLGTKHPGGARQQQAGGAASNSGVDAGDSRYIACTMTTTHGIPIFSARPPISIRAPRTSVSRHASEIIRGSERTGWCGASDESRCLFPRRQSRLRPCGGATAFRPSPSSKTDEASAAIGTITVRTYRFSPTGISMSVSPTATPSASSRRRSSPIASLQGRARRPRHLCQLQLLPQSDMLMQLKWFGTCLGPSGAICCGGAIEGNSASR